MKKKFHCKGHMNQNESIEIRSWSEGERDRTDG